MYDIIGDIHGHAGALENLLRAMDYEKRNGTWRHSERQALFVGDLIDRGPEVPRTLKLVRRMVDSGNARIVLGNHEWNALGSTTRDPENPKEYVRARDPDREKSFAPTREALGDQLDPWLQWFRHLPFYLDLGELRVVHASWSPRALKVLDEHRAGTSRISDEIVIRGFEPGTELFEATETVLKGPEHPLPDGVSFPDKDGNPRSTTRIRWFESPDGKALRDWALPANPEIPPDCPAEPDDRLEPYPADAPPVFFGHYWLDGSSAPEPQAPNVACLDYSIAKGGFLCAYRWEGESRLSAERFVRTRS